MFHTIVFLIKLVILERIEERWIHAPSGRTYNLSYNPPKNGLFDDLTGERLVKRSDDDPIAFKKRLEEYEKLTRPLIEYYKETNILFNFYGKTSDEITPKILNTLMNFQ
jgi:nucleoside-triphosphate--adenylate kinase